MPPTITFRFREYKDPNSRGTWMLINGRQYQRISSRQLSQREIDAFRKQLALNQRGYMEKRKNVYQKRQTPTETTEVKLGDLNDEVIDITKDEDTNEWKKEKKVDRDYVDSENPKGLETVLEAKEPEEPKKIKVEAEKEIYK